MTKKLNHNVKFLDEALAYLHKATVSESAFFKIDSDLSDEYFTRIRSVSRTAIPLVIDFSRDGIDVHLSGASEVFSWGNGQIENRAGEIIQMLLILLTSNIEVISYGANFKKFIFREAYTDKVLKEMKVFDGLFVNPFKKDKQLFFALI